MKKVPNLVLKGTICLIGLGVLALCTIVLPAGLRTNNVGGYRPILLGMYLPAIPFYIALFQGLKILTLIDKNQVFTAMSVKALRIIKICAGAICAMYAAGMPYIFTVADRDDAPGVVLIGLIIVFASFVVATAAALFQDLMQNAVTIKKENELTV